MVSKKIISGASLCLALSVLGCAAAIDYAREIYVRLDSTLVSPDITITLNNSFIDKYKNRTSISVQLIIDRASRGPKPDFLDGDFHFSGRVAEIGLPVVAEIKNSGREKEAIDEVQEHAGRGKPVRVSGAWRLWFEHAGEGDEVQGEPVPELRYTNPDHVFEVHPVTQVQDARTIDSFHPVPGYHPGDARDAFENYEKTYCTITPQGEKTSIVTRKGEFNDVEFLMEIIGEQMRVPDGIFLYATVRDLKGSVLAEKVRMVFVKDSEPEKIVKGRVPGARLHVFGLPRLNLDAVSRYKAKGEIGESRKVPLPYEIVIVGVYGEAK